MTVLSAMQSATLRVVGQRPASFFGSPETLEMEMSDLVNEVARDIQRFHDWQALTKIHTIIPNGEEYPLPTDYNRMALVSDVQSVPYSLMWGYYHAPNVNEFLAFKESLWANNIGGGVWTIMGDKFNFFPAPNTEAKFVYISGHFALDGNSGLAKAEFTDDTDKFLLPNRLLTLGLVWRYREMKKLDFSGDQEAFMKALSEESAKDGGSRVIRKGSRAWPLNLHPSWTGRIRPF